MYSLILSSHLFFCLPLLLFPFTAPRRIVFATPEDSKTWPNHLSFRFLTRVRSSSYSPMAAGSFCEPSHCYHGPCTKCPIASGIISSQRPAFLSNSAVKVQDSQAYRNMEMTRDYTSFIFDPKDTFVISPNGLQLCKSCSGCAIFERISGLEPSSETTAPRDLKIVTVTSFCPFTFISLSGCHCRCLPSVWSSRL